MAEQTLARYLLMPLLVMAVSLVFYYVQNREKILRKRWQLVAEGEFKKAIQRQADFNIYPGVAGQGSLILPIEITTIFFKDEKTVKVTGIKDFPPPGTRIKVYKNPLPEFKIEMTT